MSPGHYGQQERRAHGSFSRVQLTVQPRTQCILRYRGHGILKYLPPTIKIAPRQKKRRVEISGIEPETSRMLSRRSTKYSTAITRGSLSYIPLLFYSRRDSNSRPSACEADVITKDPVGVSHSSRPRKPSWKLIAFPTNFLRRDAQKLWNEFPAGKGESGAMASPMRRTGPPRLVAASATRFFLSKANGRRDAGTVMVAAASPGHIPDIS